MQVVNALIKADKDFDLLVIPGAGHGAAETPYGSRRRAGLLRAPPAGRRTAATNDPLADISRPPRSAPDGVH